MQGICTSKEVTAKLGDAHAKGSKLAMGSFRRLRRLLFKGVVLTLLALSLLVIFKKPLFYTHLLSIVAGADSLHPIEQIKPSSLSSAATVLPYEDPIYELNSDDLRYRLAEAYPYDRTSAIPKTIWQMWKDNLDSTLKSDLKSGVESWRIQENYEYRLITDNEMESTIDELYSDFPEIRRVYDTLPKAILKFDFFRYLVLYAKGGIYTDIDTTSLVPLSSWMDTDEKLPAFFSNEKISNNIGFVVGIEGDYDQADWKYKIAKRVQFCQWTFKSKIGHPILRELIYTIVQITTNNYNQRLNHVQINREFMTMHSFYTVLNWTGPGAFTDAIFAYFNKIYKMSNVLNRNPPGKVQYEEFEYFHREKNSVNLEENIYIGWQNFTRMTKPILYDDVLVLPINSFNALNEYVEFDVDNTLNYVKHDFKGSWKTNSF